MPNTCPCGRLYSKFMYSITLYFSIFDNKHEKTSNAYLDFIVDFHFIISKIVVKNWVDCDVIEMDVFANLKNELKQVQYRFRNARKSKTTK